MRDKYTHHRELPNTVKEITDSDEKYYNFFASLFPYLMIQLYRILKVQIPLLVLELTHSIHLTALCVMVNGEPDIVEG